MNKIYVKIDGIHCEHCINKITKELLKNKKINDVKIVNNIAHITYNGKLNHKEIIDSISNIDYITKEEYITDNLKDIDTKINLKEFIIILTIIVLVLLSLNDIFGFNVFNMIPVIDSGVSYGMVFVTGLITSVHCVSMCGSINLYVSASKQISGEVKGPILYNLGRVTSYTIIGGICGVIGRVISINNTVNGIIILIASIFMIILSLNMLGFTKIKLPKLFRINLNLKKKSSFLIGIANGLMPCGPLQAMQLYALSTGSLFLGALSMFLFGLGTVPLMLGFGLIFNITKGKKRIIINKVGSVLILVLSLIMLNRAFNTLNIDLFKENRNYGEYTTSIIEKDYQVVEFDLEYNDYEDIILQKGIPVKMIINVDKKYLTGCNQEFYSVDFDFRKKLEEGKNIIEFTPTEEGVYAYTCYMGMIRNHIKVVDDIDYFGGK